MAKALVMEGELLLWCQEGGFADDAWELEGASLDDIVAEHFGAERAEHSGNRYIGPVRITIERISPHHASEEEG